MARPLLWGCRSMHIAPHVTTLATESAFEILARAQALASRGRSVINLGIGQPDFPTPPHIVEAACRALQSTAITATRPPTASPRCARRSPPTRRGASAWRSTPVRSWSCPAAR